MRLSFNKAFPFLGIRGKLLIAFVGLAVIPLATQATCGLRASNQALARTNAEHLRLQLLSNIGHLESYLALLEANAEMLARWVEESGAFDGDDIDSTGRTMVERLFYHFARMRPDYYQIRLLCSRGREQVRINRHGDGRHGLGLEIVAEDQLQNKSDRYYFRDAMADSSGRAYFSPLDLNVERGEVEVPEQLVLRVAHKTRDPRGVERGLVVLNVFAREILDRLKVLRPDPRAEVLFIGDEGRFVREDCASGRCAYKFGRIQEHPTAVSPEIARSILRGETGVMVEGPQHFVSYAPMRAGGPGRESRWRLAIIYPKERVLGPVQRMRAAATSFTLGVVVVALALAVLATRTLTRPIKDILRFVQGISVGDFQRKLKVATRDEIELLADGVRSMAQALDEAQRRMIRWNEELKAEVASKVNEIETLLETKHAMERQLRQADRLSSLGMLSASLAHEIGNPLAGIKTVIQVHLRAPGVSPGTREALELVLAEVDRLAQILERVTGFVRPVRDRPVQVALGDVFRRIVFLLERQARKQEVALVLEGDGVDYPIVAEAQKLEQVVLNLVVNSLQAMTERGNVRIGAWRTPGGLEIVVSDTGPGIPEASRDKVFEPFYTTKAGGTGLGLSIVQQIVTEMRGTVRLEFPDSGGTRVRIDLPSVSQGEGPRPLEETT
ncbi:MAG: HAMP domain-containing protein [Deltaproteobacteria bacterium]|nr:HAMP domain-containing protein [Deltaproteobacteria bacterium]